MPVFTLFGQPAGFSTLTADNANYVMGVQFTTSQAGTLTAIWWFSPPGAGALPGTIDLWQVSGASLVASQVASWSGAAGSGWVRAPFTSPPALTPGTAYKAAIFKNDGAVASFYGSIANYWSSGAGSGGITSGPLTAPNNGGGDGGQDTFNASNANAYPATSFNATNYGVDPEVTTQASPAQSPIPADQATASGGDLYAATWQRYPIRRYGT